MRLLRQIASVLKRGVKVDESFFAELEERLIEADVGLTATQKILDSLRDALTKRRFDSSEEIVEILKEGLIAILSLPQPPPLAPGLQVILMVGVNGTGKTTSMAKLAHYYLAQGRKVILACSDTYRAAAGEQFSRWTERLGVPSVVGQDGADPASVAFDAADAALRRGNDLLLIDTAGRQHTRTALMQQLQKIRRVLANRLEGAPHQTLLVLDATTGQNALSQAQSFAEQMGITGIMLTKFDGTAKGGIVIAIADRFGIPICWVGTGEGLEHLERFDPTAFVRRIFE